VERDTSSVARPTEQPDGAVAVESPPEASGTAKRAAAEMGDLLTGGAPATITAEGEDGFGAGLEDAFREEAGGGSEPGRPSAFDFNQPRNISKLFEQNLRNLGENFAKLASVSLTNLLRANTSLEFRELRLSPGGDYLSGLPNPTCVATVALPPLQGRSLLHLDLALCFSMLKKLMGGAGEPEEMVREFTEIERSVFRSVTGKLLELLRGAGSRLVALEPAFVGLENNPDYLTGVAAGDTFMLLGFQFKLDTQAGGMEFAIPMTSFAPVRDAFDPQERREMRSAQEVRRDRRQVLTMLNGAGAEVVIKLAEVSTSLQQLMSLREGEIFSLGEPVDSPLVVEIERKPLFRGEAGRVRQKRAVRLTGRIQEE
jgi:flagellar motor switch protein FliM